MDADLAFKIVVGLMVFGIGIAGFSGLSVWAVFYFGSKAKLKVTSTPTEEKIKCRYSDCEMRGDRAEEDEQVTCPTCRNDLGLPEL